MAEWCQNSGDPGENCRFLDGSSQEQVEVNCGGSEPEPKRSRNHFGNLKSHDNAARRLETLH